MLPPLLFSFAFVHSRRVRRDAGGGEGWRLGSLFAGVSRGGDRWSWYFVEVLFSGLRFEGGFRRRCRWDEGGPSL